MGERKVVTGDSKLNEKPVATASFFNFPEVNTKQQLICGLEEIHLYTVSILSGLPYKHAQNK